MPHKQPVSPFPSSISLLPFQHTSKLTHPSWYSPRSSSRPTRRHGLRNRNPQLARLMRLLVSLRRWLLLKLKLPKCSSSGRCSSSRTNDTSDCCVGEGFFFGCCGAECHCSIECSSGSKSEFYRLVCIRSSCSPKRRQVIISSSRGSKCRRFPNLIDIKLSSRSPKRRPRRIISHPQTLSARRCRRPSSGCGSD